MFFIPSLQRLEVVLIRYQHPTSGPSFQLQAGDWQGDTSLVSEGGERWRWKGSNQTCLLSNASDFRHSSQVLIRESPTEGWNINYKAYK